MHNLSCDKSAGETMLESSAKYVMWSVLPCLVDVALMDHSKSSSESVEVGRESRISQDPIHP